MKKLTLLLTLMLSSALIFAQDHSEKQTPTPNYRLASKLIIMCILEQQLEWLML